MINWNKTPPKRLNVDVLAIAEDGPTVAYFDGVLWHASHSGLLIEVTHWAAIVPKPKFVKPVSTP